MVIEPVDGCQELVANRGFGARRIYKRRQKKWLRRRIPFGAQAYSSLLTHGVKT
jgi:hypothetical protein